MLKWNKKRTLGDQVNHPCKVWALCLMTRPRQLHEMSLVVVTLVNFLHVVYGTPITSSTGFNLPLCVNKVHEIYTPNLSCTRWRFGYCWTSRAITRWARRVRVRLPWKLLVSRKLLFALQIALTIGVANEGTISLAMFAWVTVRLFLYLSITPFASRVLPVLKIHFFDSFCRNYTLTKTVLNIDDH